MCLAVASCWPQPPVRPAESVAMVSEGQETGPFDLPRGWNKQAVVYLGRHPVAAIFDTGSFRNVISEDFLVKLELLGAKGDD
eukprot:2352312-Lingulodinium_polyedra.AAC.1